MNRRGRGEAVEAIEKVRGRRVCTTNAAEREFSSTLSPERSNRPAALAIYPTPSTAPPALIVARSSLNPNSQLHPHSTHVWIDA